MQLIKLRYWIHVLYSFDWLTSVTSGNHEFKTQAEKKSPFLCSKRLGDMSVRKKIE